MYLKYREILAIFMRRIPDTEDNKNEVFRSDAERFSGRVSNSSGLKMKLAGAQASALPYGY